MASALVEIEYECRGGGYGVERGAAKGFWKDRTWTGAREFRQVFTDEGSLYLFDDEVLTEVAL